MHPYNPYDQTIKTDSNGVAVKRSFLANYEIEAAKVPAQSDTAVLPVTTQTGVAQQITAGITSPAIPRSIRVKGNAVGNVGNVVITGTNFNGTQITETIALNGATAVEGSKAFKTVTRIDLPIQTHAGTDTVSVGFGNKLGLPYLLPRNTVRAAYLNNVKEATDPTVTISNTALESNTVLLSSSLSGTQVNIYLMV